MLTGVDSHASMSEESRLESCEKDIEQLKTWIRDLLKVVKENRQDLDGLEGQCQEMSNSLGSAENEISFIKERLSGEPESPKADSSSEEELSA